MDPVVTAAMNECYQRTFYNPSSQHSEGRRARQQLEQARETIGIILGAQLKRTPTDRILFTSGGTESNNLAITGLYRNSEASLHASPVITSAVEHPSVLAATNQLPEQRRRIAPVNADGIVDLEALEELLTPSIRCVSLMLGNHETGAIQPVQQVAQRCNQWNIPVHTDAVQAAGKIPVNFSELGVAALSATAHKFHGPPGIGVLILRPDVAIQPLFYGGSQQLGTRPGTESVALAVGMAKALEQWQSEHVSRQHKMESLRNQLQANLLAEIPELVVNGPVENSQRLPHVLNVSFPGQDRQALLLALDLAGLACATGSACESGSSQPSHVLRAMNASPSVVNGSIRISLSSQTTAEEIEQATRILVTTANQMAPDAM